MRPKSQSSVHCVKAVFRNVQLQRRLVGHAQQCVMRFSNASCKDELLIRSDKKIFASCSRVILPAVIKSFLYCSFVAKRVCTRSKCAHHSGPTTKCSAGGFARPLKPNAIRLNDSGPLSFEDFLVHYSKRRMVGREALQSLRARWVCVSLAEFGKGGAAQNGGRRTM